MSKTVLILTPHFPPARGGVADHSLLLAERLADKCDVMVLTSVGNTGVGSTRYKVHAKVKNWSNVDELFIVMESLDPAEYVIWQYVPHMYGRGGVNLQMPKAVLGLGQLRRQQLIIAHEIAAPFSILPHRLWYALAQRWQWKKLVDYADVVGISTEAWVQHWAEKLPKFRDKLRLLPSPSTIPVLPVETDHASAWRKAQGLDPQARIIAFFGSQSDAKQFNYVVSAWRQSQKSGRSTVLVVIGEPPAYQPPPELQSLYKPLGYLQADEVSRALQAVDVLALPYIDGVSERRTSFMAGLSHGCAVVTTLGHNTGPTLRSAKFFIGREAGDEAGFATAVANCLEDAAERKSLGEMAQTTYEVDYSWSHVLEEVNAALSYRMG